MCAKVALACIVPSFISRVVKVRGADGVVSRSRGAAALEVLAKRRGAVLVLGRTARIMSCHVKFQILQRRFWIQGGLQTEQNRTGSCVRFKTDWIVPRLWLFACTRFEVGGAGVMT